MATIVVPTYHDALNSTAYYVAGAPPAPIADDTQAGIFLNGIDQAVAIVATYPHDVLPSVLEDALTAAVDLAADCLTDAEIHSEHLETFGGISRAQRVNIAFPDGSHVTAIVASLEDQADLFPERITDESWYGMARSPYRVTINPWGKPGMRVFDILEHGDNSAPYFHDRHPISDDDYPSESLSDLLR